jgi:hypothetical protein
MEHVFTLTDADGNPHTYAVTRHRGSEGYGLAQLLLGLVLEPLAAAAGPPIVAAVTRGGLGVVLDDPAILAALDLAGLARALRGSLLGLSDATIGSILRYVNRDGKPLIGEGNRPTGVFDAAYAGNYAELGAVLWEVVRYNRFFPGLDTFADAARKALAAKPGTPTNGG